MNATYIILAISYIILSSIIIFGMMLAYKVGHQNGIKDERAHRAKHRKTAYGFTYKPDKTIPRSMSRQLHLK